MNLKKIIAALSVSASLCITSLSVFSQICPVAVADENIIISNGFSYSILSDGTIEILSGDVIGGKVSIPSEINGIKVTSIGNSAFRDQRTLENIDIPDSITKIGDYAFRDCLSLKSVDIPDSVKSIGIFAFYNCHSMTDINIPDSITMLNDFTFTDCYSLKSIHIPESVKAINSSMFKGCTNLTDVTLPNSITFIAPEMFSDCKNLKYINIPSSVTYIGQMAFNNCHSLININILDNITNIEPSAFSNCDNLTIYGYSDSKAEQYANEYNIPFIAIGVDFENVTGDITNNGSFGIGDVVILEKWLLGKTNYLVNWQMGDFYRDGILDIYDLSLMKSQLTKAK